jgi:hypothetical protein
MGPTTVLEGNCRSVSYFLGEGFRRGRTRRHLGPGTPDSGQIDAIGVDEIQYAKGHKYLTLVYQIDIGITRLLWIGKERTIESLQGFFTAMGKDVISKIVFVCSDMWEPYLKLIRENCSEGCIFSTASTSSPI